MVYCAEMVIDDRRTVMSAQESLKKRNKEGAPPQLAMERGDDGSDPGELAPLRAESVTLTPPPPPASFAALRSLSLWRILSTSSFLRCIPSGLYLRPLLVVLPGEDSEEEGGDGV